MTNVICLNADLGEMPGPDGRATDAAMLAVVTRCNIACGGHAGDEATMRETVRRAREYGVQAGAHPSYPDRDNFGRLSLQMPAAELAAALEQQTYGLIRVAIEEGGRIVHLKPHGALYNDAARDRELAQTIVRVAADAGLAEIIGPPNSALESAALSAGLAFVPEGFADRTYEPDGSLTPRSVDGAVVSDPEGVLERALGLAREGTVGLRSGGRLALNVKTICLHSDTPGAALHAQTIRDGLEAAGVEVRA